MIAFSCDSCGNIAPQTFRADGAIMPPPVWIQAKIAIAIGQKTTFVKAHFCSLTCVKKFDEPKFKSQFERPADNIEQDFHRADRNPNI